MKRITNFALNTRTTAVVCFAACWIIAAPAQSQSSQDALPTEADSLLQAAIVATVNQQYDSAFSLIDRVTATHPDHPLGHLFKAATLQSMMLDYEDYSQEEELFDCLKKCRHLAENVIRKDRANAWGLFYLGSSYAYQSFFESKKGSYLSAFHSGMKSIKYLEGAIYSNPNLYDAYLGIGTYKYYRSKFTQKLKLPFLGDDSQQGIEMVRQAARHGTYSQLAALNGLVWILLDEKETEAAYAISDSILQIYPKSRFFLWGAAEAAKRLGRHEQAIDHYQRIHDSLQRDGRLSGYLDAMLKTKMARVALKSGQKADACQRLAAAATLEIEDHPRNRDLKDSIADLLERCEGVEASSNGHTTGE